METAEFYFNQGIELFEKRIYELAIESFTKAIEINPNYTNAYLNRGITKFQLKQYQEAIIDYSKVINIDVNYSDAYYNRANCYLLLTRFYEAIIDYKKVTELNTLDYDAFLKLGTCYSVLKDYKKAVKYYTISIDINPLYFLGYNNRGYCYIELKDFQKAIKDHTKVLEFYPNLPKAYFYIGVSQNGLNKYYEAINNFNKAIEINTRYFEAYNFRGISYSELKNYEVAFYNFNKSIEINPKYSNPYLNKSKLYNITNKISKSFYEINTYIYLCSTQKEVLFGLNHIIDIYENHPQNIQYLLSHFEVDVEALIINPFHSILDKNKDLNLILTCLKRGKWHTDLEMQTLESIFYYHMGGCLSSYSILDEIEISTYQESFYWVLSSKEIQLRFKEDFGWAIKEIKETENEIDNYYIGQLYLLNENVSQAITYFEKSKDFIFSKIMLAFCTEDIIEKEKLIHEINILDLDTFLEINTDFIDTYIKEMDYEKKDIEKEKNNEDEKEKTNPNFNLVFHFFECQEAIIHLYTYHGLNAKNYSTTFHSFFKLDKEHKRKLNDLLYDFDILEEIVRIFKDFDSELQINLDLTETEKNFKDFKKEKYEEIFKKIKKKVKKNKNVERKLFKVIESFEIKYDIKFYVLLIAYGYGNRKIDLKQVFFLVLFLIKIIDKHRQKQLDDSVTETINTGLDIGKTVTGNLGLKIFFGLAKSGAPKLIEYLYQNDETIKRDTEYYTFKKNILKFFKLEKNSMKEHEFNKKYKLADYFIGINDL